MDNLNKSTAILLRMALFITDRSQILQLTTD